MIYDDMISAVRDMVQDLAQVPVQIGIPGPDPGIWVSINAAGVTDVYFDRSERRSVVLTLYVKNASQAVAADSADHIGRLITRAPRYPTGPGWRILTASANGAVPVEQESSTKLWLYANNIEINYYS